MIRLSDQEFEQIAGYVHTQYGINLYQKRTLIEARMNALLAQYEMDSFTQFMDAMKKDTRLVDELLNRLTTNHTYFMREPEHYDFIKNVFLPQMAARRSREIRIWSAGSSTGDEAYTAAMLIMDYFGPNAASWDFRILATDISERAMDKAQKAVYDESSLKNLPERWLKIYFEPAGEGLFRLKQVVRDQVIFRKMNLMDPFPFKRPMDLVFCRNVMIYFDQPTRDQLARKFYDVLSPGGYLLIGHAETLRRESHPFRYEGSSIYHRAATAAERRISVG